MTPLFRCHGNTYVNKKYIIKNLNLSIVTGQILKTVGWFLCELQSFEFGMVERLETIGSGLKKQICSS